MSVNQLILIISPEKHSPFICTFNVGMVPYGCISHFTRAATVVTVFCGDLSPLAHKYNFTWPLKLKRNLYNCLRLRRAVDVAHISH